MEMEKRISPDFTFQDLILNRVFDVDFMYSKYPHNYVVDCMARFLEEYWKEHDECDYLFLMVFQAVAVEEDQKFREICQEMLRHSSFSIRDQDALGHKIRDQSSYSKSEWEKMKKFPIHKIHWIAQINKMKFKEGTYGYKLIHGELD